MKANRYKHLGLAAGFFLLSGTLALAQSNPAPQHPATTHTPSATAPHHTTHASTPASNRGTGSNPMYGSKSESKANSPTGTSGASTPHSHPATGNAKVKPGTHGKSADAPKEDLSVHYTHIRN